MKNILITAFALLLVAGAAGAQADVLCESVNGKFRECRVSGAGRITLTRQLSDTACVEGENWGVRNGMVWVSGGCRGEFAVTAFDVGTGTTLVCESLNNVRHTCRAKTAGGVTIARQISDNICVRDKTWGVNDEGIWVDKGCRAEFTIHDAGSMTQRANAALVRCGSRNNTRSTCPADTSFGVSIAKRVSKNACVHGRDWGWDENGIWVKNGCRADFAVGGWMTPMTSAAMFVTTTCESRDGKQTFCRANTANGISLIRQLSDASCVLGKSWGYDQNGVWVKDGCRAEFSLGIR